MYQSRLSALTPAVVDTLYNIDHATPRVDPVFLFLVGAPGSGKSSGHGRAIEAGLIPAGDYATINMDILLESLLPFRAASSMAHFLKEDPATRDLVRFSTIPVYGSRKEDLGLFHWYDEAHTQLKETDPTTIHDFNRVRDRFAALSGKETEDRLLDVNSAAIQRAIDRRVPIIYETTLYLSKEGRVNKVDGIMRYLKKTPYRIVFYHIRGDPADISRRIQFRQEHGGTQEAYPFYRYVPTSIDAVTEYVETTQAAFDALRRQYKKRAMFEELENPFDPARLPAEEHRSRSTRRRRIVTAYTTDTRPELYVSPLSSSTFHLSSSERSNKRRTTKRS